MEFDRRIKTTASYQSQGINLENCVGLFQYSYWLLRNFCGFSFVEAETYIVIV